MIGESLIGRSWCNFRNLRAFFVTLIRKLLVINHLVDADLWFFEFAQLFLYLFSSKYCKFQCFRWYGPFCKELIFFKIACFIETKHCATSFRIMRASQKKLCEFPAWTRLTVHRHCQVWSPIICSEKIWAMLKDSLGDYLTRNIQQLATQRPNITCSVGGKLKYMLYESLPLGLLGECQHDS